MAINLFEEVNNRMGQPITKKENPTVSDKKTYEKTLEGAAIPLALAGIYHLAASKEGAQRITDYILSDRTSIERPASNTCAAFTFGNKTEEVIDKITNYSGATRAVAYDVLNEAARNTYQVMLRELVNDNIKPEDITRFMVAQRHSILSHLPEALQLGHLLGDETIDDVSNKMEGPISNLMHNLGESFSGSAR
jgi:hypothetical protein